LHFSVTRNGVGSAGQALGGSREIEGNEQCAVELG
jgi:hypothetical protein